MPAKLLALTARATTPKANLHNFIITPFIF
jgi:hypothetical protein